MAPGADPAFQQAMDKLMLQVNQDNILAVHHAFQKHADELRFCLQQAGFTIEFGPCGGDPVSHDVLKNESIGGKIRQLVDVHWKHWEELEAVAAHLRETALSYGHTEDDVRQSLSQGRSR